MANRLSILGTGKLGLCLGLNLERAGYHVTCYDINENYVNELTTKTYISAEPGVTDLIKQSNTISFTTDLISTLINFWVMVYLFLSLKFFFQQGYIITFVKNLVITIVYGSCMLTGILALFLFGFFVY